MIIHCDNSYIPAARDYIGADRVLCFYLYMDMMEYGAENKDMDLWLCDDGGIRAVFYRYHDAIHMFSRGDWPQGEVEGFLRAHPVKVVSMSEEDAARLAPLFADCERELSHVITATKTMTGRDDLDIRPAGREDAAAIAELMMRDATYNTVYSYDELYSQTIERLESGFGRLFVIRRDGRVIATNCTAAETEDLAVISGLVTDPAERGQGLGRAITAYTWNLVRDEGKMGLAHLACDNENTVRLHRQMGYDFLGIRARFLRISYDCLFQSEQL